MITSKSIRLFLVDGTPSGLVTAEILNWSGHVLVAPRSMLPELLKRSEAKRTGVYFLLGDDPDGIRDKIVYVGESDDIGRRLTQHALPEEKGGKEFWDHAVIVTSKDPNVTKAHARYLESQFISLGLRAQRAKVMNSTTPAPILLPEADVSDMEYFVSQTLIVLPVLGVNVFRPARTSPVDTAAQLSDCAPNESVPHSGSKSVDYELNSRKHGILARAQESDGEFTVLLGSVAVLAWKATSDHSYRRLREQLEENGTLAMTENGSQMRFTRDYVFNSPSAAAAVVLGRPSNGRKLWNVCGTQVSYDEWALRQIQIEVEATGDASDESCKTYS